MTRVDTGITLPGTAAAPEPLPAATVADLIAQAGDLADRTERTYRPTSYIVLAAAALLLSLLFVGYYALARSSASSRYQAEVTRAAAVHSVDHSLTHAHADAHTRLLGHLPALLA